jgi:hypothetical protein
MVINSKLKQKKRRGKCSPVLLHDKITTGRARRTRNIILWTEGRENLREEGEKNSEQFSNTEIRRGK